MVLDESKITGDTITPAEYNEVAAAVNRITDSSGNVRNSHYITVGLNSDSDYDCDGTDDDVQIQQAIDAVNADGGGVVLIKDGIYDINAAIILKPNVSLIGDGARTILTRGSNIEMINATATLTNVTIDSITFRGAAYANEIIDLGDHTDHNNITITHNIFENCAGRAVFVDGTDITFAFNYCDDVNAGFGTITHAGEVSPVVEYKMLVIGNKIFNNSFTNAESEGIEINIHETGSCIVSMNHVEGFQEEGIDFNSSRGMVTNNTVIMDSTVVSTCNGITANVNDTGVDKSRVTIANNVVKEVPTSGRGIHVSKAKACTIMGNTIEGNGTGSIGINLDSDTASENLKVAFNHLKDLTYGVNNDANEKSRGFLNTYESCTNDWYEPNSKNALINIDDSSFYQDDAYTNIWDGFRVGNTNTNPLTIHRLGGAEKVDIDITDNDLRFTYNQDETDTSEHDILFNTVSTATGDKHFMFQANGTDVGGFVEDTTVDDNAIIKLGTKYLWIDSTGDLRVKSSAPTSDTDGTVVGTQS